MATGTELNAALTWSRAYIYPRNNKRGLTNCPAYHYIIAYHFISLYKLGEGIVRGVPVAQIFGSVSNSFGYVLAVSVCDKRKHLVNAGRDPG